MPTQSQLQVHELVTIAERESALFHDDETAFADVEVDGHRETWPVRSKKFRMWLQRRYFQQSRDVPSRSASRSALDAIEARSLFDGEQRPVFRRVASLGSRIYLDLGNPEWQAVEIAPGEWRMVDRPPVRFTRSPNTRALPTPVRGGRVDELRGHLNLAGDDDFALVLGWIFGSLRGRGPYPVLVLHGEHGSAKSTVVEIVRGLVDPQRGALRTVPRNEWELFISAQHSHVLAYDNLSAITPWLSDGLCRLSTGGGSAARRLYSDADEVVIEATRPLILNGIEPFVTRGDLADRSVILHLPAIPASKRQPETTVLAEFERNSPRILGAILDALATGIAALPEVRLDRLPRMADWARWITACEPPAERGARVRAYERSCAESLDALLEASPVASAIQSLLGSGTEVWEGEPTELHRKLSQIADQMGTRTRGWPPNGQVLSRRLTRLSGVLRPAGIAITRTRGVRRQIRITRRDEEGDFAQIASNPSNRSTARD